MKVITAFVVISFLFFNSAVAEEKKKEIVSVDPTSSITSVVGVLAGQGYLSEKFNSAINGLDGNQELKPAERERLWETNIKYRFLGIKKIGLRPWYPELVSPLALPFDDPLPDEMLYQIIYHLTLKDLDGKILKFLVIDNVADQFVWMSRPLIMQDVPPYKIIGGDWEDNLQFWERLKNKETKITPNLIK